MVMKQEDLQRVVDQVNSRFNFFTQKIEELEKRVAELEKTPSKKEKANG